METSTSGFGQTPSSKQLSLVNKIVHEELVEIYLLLPALEPSNCLLSDFGDYLCRTTDTIAQLAHRIVHGNHIPEYARLNVAEMAERMDLSELGFLDHLTAKHSILKFGLDAPSSMFIANRRQGLGRETREREQRYEPGLE
jgi:hypothetical protein